MQPIFKTYKIILLLISTCSNETSLYSNDVQLLDASVQDVNQLVCPPGIPDYCLSFCTDTRWDIENCGFCGNTCINSDNCFEGNCRCGANIACPKGTYCIAHQCLAPDPKGLPCEENGYCGPEKFCVGGFCTIRECTPEICDGFDNDCNGLVDDPMLALANICYTGLSGTANVGTCHYGLSLCLGGRYGPCKDESRPSLEEGILSCDGLDNDCNGCADNSYGVDGECQPRPEVQYDTIFYIDYSGSMPPYIAAVIDAVTTMGSPFRGNDNYHWALIGIPANTADRVPTLLNDLTEYSIFENTLSLQGTSTYGGTCEPNISAPLLAISGLRPPLSYRPGSVKLDIIFSDEEAQACTKDTGVVITDGEALCRATTSTGRILAVFSSTWFLDQWGSCALAYPISASGAEMADSLSEIYSTVCSP